jgi:hypothetical protein
MTVGPARGKGTGLLPVKAGKLFHSEAPTISALLKSNFSTALNTKLRGTNAWRQTPTRKMNAPFVKYYTNAED